MKSTHKSDIQLRQQTLDQFDSEFDTYRKIMGDYLAAANIVKTSKSKAERVSASNEAAMREGEMSRSFTRIQGTLDTLCTVGMRGAAQDLRELFDRFVDQMLGLSIRKVAPLWEERMYGDRNIG